MISTGTKVNALVRGQVLPAVVVFHHFASTRIYDLYMLRIAEYSQAVQRWQISEYGPVGINKLTKRETHVPGLDLDEKAKRRLRMTPPSWVRQIRG